MIDGNRRSIFERSSGGSNRVAPERGRGRRWTWQAPGPGGGLWVDFFWVWWLESGS